MSDVLSQLISHLLKIRLIDACVVKFINLARLSKKKKIPTNVINKIPEIMTYEDSITDRLIKKF